MLQAVTHLRPHLQSANISYSMQKKLFFKIGYVCKIPYCGEGGGYDHLAGSLLSSSYQQSRNNYTRYIWRIRIWDKCNFLGVFQALWQIRIQATNKIHIEPKCRTCVINTFEIRYDEYVRILHTCNKYIILQEQCCRFQALRVTIHR